MPSGDGERRCKCIFFGLCYLEPPRHPFITTDEFNTDGNCLITVEEGESTPNKSQIVFMVLSFRDTHYSLIIHNRHPPCLSTCHTHTRSLSLSPSVRDADRFLYITLLYTQ